MNKAAALTKRETQIMRRRGSRTNAWWRMIRARKLRNEGLTLQKIEIAGQKMRRMSESGCSFGCGAEQG